MILTLIIVAGVLAMRAWGLTAEFDRYLWETRFSLDQRPVSGEIVMVDIDARSLDQLGVWPLPRRIYADLIDRLNAAGAEEIVFDVDFSSASDAEEDRIFASAIERAGNVSLAVFLQSATADPDSGQIINRPLDMFLENAWPVVVMVPMEDDSRIWRNLYGYDIGGTTELSVASYMSGYSGDPAGAFTLDFGIAIDQLPRVSLIDALNAAADEETFAGRKVIVGASALELRDLFAVPVFDLLPGSLIQALGAETLIQNRALTIGGEGVAVAGVLIVLLLLMMTSIDGWRVKVVILGLCAVVIEVIAFALHKNETLLASTASAHIALLIAAAGVVFRELGFHKILLHVTTIGKRNSERMLGLVFDDSFDAIVVLNAQGRITAASQVARTLFKCHEPVGKAAADLLPQDLVDEANSVLAMQSTTVPVPKISVLHRHGEKHRYIEYVVTRSERAVAKADRRRQVETQAVACLTCRDVTEERESAAQLKYLARFNPITGLLNRAGFEDELTKLAAGTRTSGRDLLVVQFAIINLDQIIASLGFSFGDKIRHAVASRLKNYLEHEVVWSAITADVFAGALAIDPDADFEESFVETVERVVGEDYSLDGSRITVQLKFGYVRSNGPMAADEVLKASGNALSRVRRETRSAVLAFRPEMNEALERRRKLETELFKAIVRDELRVVYQPLVDLKDGAIVGAEALLRWEHRLMGSISPVEFIPIAEENGYIVELGAWVLNRAMKEAMTLSDALRLSVNVSAIQFSRGNVVSTVIEALDRTNFPAGRLDLEITESLFIDESLDLRFCMEELKALGCSFSLDDFGTGYSSLGYIPKYPFSKIKLDRSFVRENIDSEKDIAIIEAVLHLASGNNMSVLVEGIETPDQARKLCELGCQYGQGYLYGRPMSAIELSALLASAGQYPELKTSCS
ncbi:EAL domain-containing protein [Roseibium aggregatum]|uniref:EAL domain-containing protein n=1 Tax=Roseibium aggregatum TaxID=187304 RepID=A0A939EBS7_9HYPH|nr:EAL domain-containing protein [Roseibium aggregatum]MBN9670307.1 EAL domain-containing protein [Roseibium aggregatum]